MTLLFAIVKFKISPKKLKDFLSALSTTGDINKVKVGELLRHAKAMDRSSSAGAKKDTKTF